MDIQTTIPEVRSVLGMQITKVDKINLYFRPKQR